jgi:hypothetical protein
MLSAFFYLGISLGSTYLLWIFYLAVMNLKGARDKELLNKFTYALAVPVLAVGIVLDIAVNVFVMSVLLLELPKELTVTSRLKRHNKESTGYRKSVAKFFEPLLDPFDPDGDHI